MTIKLILSLHGYGALTETVKKYEIEGLMGVGFRGVGFKVCSHHDLYPEPGCTVAKHVVKKASKTFFSRQVDFCKKTFWSIERAAQEAGGWPPL